MKVIDSSSVAKYVNREENWEPAAEALRGSCVSLELAVKETGNSLWKRFRRGELSDKQAKQFFAEFVASRPFTIADQAELYAPAFEIATSFALPIYDALFLALSKEKSLPLVTSDPSQAEAARKMGLEVQFIE
ncbi:MAG: type II toxin-antitoxin system VapC family toxin [Nitrososphaerales archaeon]|nr:type II toxin-antitoxin system VapC family toxin [Nitrososphaerales archaeon]